MTPFHALHHAASPLMLPTAWDAASALALQLAGAQAVGTSSAALAWSLGHPDGDALPRSELLQAVQRMQRVLRVPLSVDIESGYSREPEAVASLVMALAALDVAGINIEDGDQAPALLAAKIQAIREALGGRPLFINARTDVHLRALADGPAAQAMTRERLGLYQAAGADGFFVPGLTAAVDIVALTHASALPVNLMALPGLPDVAECQRLGVRRLSAGPAPMLSAYAQLDALAGPWLQGRLAWPPTPCLSHGIMNARLQAALTP